MVNYNLLDDLVIDALFKIQPYKKPLIAWYLKPRRMGVRGQYSLDSIVESDDRFRNICKLWKDEEPEHYRMMLQLHVFLKKYLLKGFLSNYFYNRIFALAGILPDICDYMRKHNAILPDFTVSNKFLKHAIDYDIFPQYLGLLSVILTVENAEFKLRTMNKEDREQVESDLEKMTILFHFAFDKLYSIARMMTIKPKLDAENVDYNHVFIQNDKPQGIKLFDKSKNAKVIIIVGDKGTGKTIALFRCIYSIWKQGYTVIVFGEDIRKEFRFATKPLLFDDKRQLFYILTKKQKEKTCGLPITIYTKEPKYSFEHDVKDFKGLKTEWNRLKGVVLFEHDLVRIMNGFIKYRSENRTKKMVMCLNEAQNFVSSQSATGSEFYLFYKSSSLFVDLRGFVIPVIMNTQSLTKISKKARQFDEYFISHIDEPGERIKIAKRVGIANLSNILGMPHLKQDHLFIHVSENKMKEVRFLIPPNLTETDTRTLRQIL